MTKRSTTDFNIGVFRRDLFKTSEHFIVQQAEAHKRPVTYVGYELHGAPPPNARYFLLNELSLSKRRSLLHDLDVIHAHFGIDALPAVQISRAAGIPLAVTLHGFDVTRTRSSCLTSLKPNLTRYGLFRKSALSSADMYLAVSSYIERRAVEAGVPRDKIFTHHIGSAAPETPLDSISDRHPEHLDRPLRLVHVARLVEKKGTRHLIDAIAILRARAVAVELEVVGDGPLRSELFELVQVLGLDDVVSFSGQLGHDEVIKRIACADALCIPSVVASNGDAEGLGMVTLEAASVGTCIIGSDSGGISDFVVNDVTGLSVPPGSPEDIAQAVNTLVMSPATKRRLALDAYKFLAAQFDVEKQTIKLEERLASLVAEGLRK